MVWLDTTNWPASDAARVNSTEGGAHVTTDDESGSGPRLKKLLPSSACASSYPIPLGMTF